MVQISTYASVNLNYYFFLFFIFYFYLFIFFFLWLVFSLPTEYRDHVKLHRYCFLPSSLLKIKSSTVRSIVAAVKQITGLNKFYTHGSVHRSSILIRSNKMQHYAGIYLLQNSSLHATGVHRTHYQENIKL